LLPLASQAIENKRRFSPELIELIEQEGAARFLVKILGETSAFGGRFSGSDELGNVNGAGYCWGMKDVRIVVYYFWV
jgi:hypothetical protein